MLRDVVTCAECVFADSFHHCGKVTWWNTGDDFCSKGIRKTNAGYVVEPNYLVDEDCHTMEEFMDGQDLGSPEDGSL